MIWTLRGGDLYHGMTVYLFIPLYVPSSSRSQQATVVFSDGMVFSRGSPWLCARYLGFVDGVR